MGVGAHQGVREGNDSHTTMVNGIGVLGWGVGGIEAEAVMLGQPLFLLNPVVVGVRFLNSLPAGTTATDLVLTLTEMLRKHGVVGKFVEFCGDGLSALSAADRATLSNMAPEYGATSALFPVDAGTLRYLRESGRPAERVELVERYAREQAMFRQDGDATPLFSELVELDLNSVVPSVAGPRRPQDRVPLDRVWESFDAVYHREPAGGGRSRPEPAGAGSPGPGGATGTTAVAEPPAAEATTLDLRDGSVVIAAITSCTNTSNPSVMLGAGLLARKAVDRGLRVPGYVKTSLAPGSRVVTDYLERAGLLDALNSLGFNLVGYGCTTCIGNSGPLDDDVARAVDAGDLAVVAVLSGNRNFEGRIHAQVKAAYLASPPLVVAYALAGSVQIDLTKDPIGRGSDGGDVFLRDLWPSGEEVEQAIKQGLGADLYNREYAHIFEGDQHWRELPSPEGQLFDWDPASTYVREPNFFAGMTPEPVPLLDILEARALASLGDSITTDHISPAGNISAKSPAAAYLRERGVELRDFNSYGARRGNHEVMVRGTFANIRLRNALTDGVEGGMTKHLPDGELMTIYDAAVRYADEGTPLIVLAGKEYGSGSSRDWAAKGTALQGVRAVIAESYERIHRSNLVGLGVLPLQYRSGENAASLGLTGRETFTIRGLAEAGPGTPMVVTARADDGGEREFETVSRLDSVTDVDYFHHGGVLLYVLRELMQG
ncbi:MAG: aconitate hydratase AcnA [Candidatus Dormibacteria bacterium]